MLLIGTIGDSVISGGHGAGHGDSGTSRATFDWQTAHLALGGGTLVVLVLLLGMVHDKDTKTTDTGPNWFCEIILTVFFAIMTIIAMALTVMTTQNIVGYFMTLVGLILGAILWIIDVILLIIAKVK